MFILVIIPAVDDGINAAIEDRREEHQVRDPPRDERGRLRVQYFPETLESFVILLSAICWVLTPDSHQLDRETKRES